MEVYILVSLLKSDILIDIILIRAQILSVLLFFLFW